MELRKHESEKCLSGISRVHQSLLEFVQICLLLHRDTYVLLQSMLSLRASHIEHLSNMKFCYFYFSVSMLFILFVTLCFPGFSSGNQCMFGTLELALLILQIVIISGCFPALLISSCLVDIWELNLLWLKLNCKQLGQLSAGLEVILLLQTQFSISIT